MSLLYFSVLYRHTFCIQDPRLPVTYLIPLLHSPLLNFRKPKLDWHTVEPNTGVMMVRSNNNSIRLMSSFLIELVNKNRIFNQSKIFQKHFVIRPCVVLVGSSTLRSLHSVYLHPILGLSRNPKTFLSSNFSRPSP